MIETREVYIRKSGWVGICLYGIYVLLAFIMSDVGRIADSLERIAASYPKQVELSK